MRNRVVVRIFANADIADASIPDVDIADFRASAAAILHQVGQERAHRGIIGGVDDVAAFAPLGDKRQGQCRRRSLHWVVF